MTTTTMNRPTNNTQGTQEYKRGDIVLVDFGKTIGSVQGGLRPAIVVQNDMGNKYSPCLTVSPVTSKMMKRPLPTHVFVPKHYSEFKEDSIVLVEQTSTIDKRSVVQHLGQLDTRFLPQINKAIAVQMGLAF